MDVMTLSKYEKLSPFEIKDFLIRHAHAASEESAISFINAGRGNPNWVSTTPRDAFFLLGQFAMTESRRVLDLPPGIGGMPKALGIAARLADWLSLNGAAPGGSFLREMVRSEEHTSELQSRQYLVCRLLLEKKKKNKEQQTKNILKIQTQMNTCVNT